MIQFTEKGRETVIEDCEEEGEYVSSLGVTDHYDSDGPLCLTKGLDYIC